MKNTKTSMFTTAALVTVVASALTLSACGGGTSNDTSATPTPTPAATPTPSATPSPTPAPTPTPARVSKAPTIYYYDETGQWRLMPGVTSGQAMAAGVLCKGPADSAQAAAWIASGKTQTWVDENIYTIVLCPGY